MGPSYLLPPPSRQVQPADRAQRLPPAPQLPRRPPPQPPPDDVPQDRPPEPHTGTGGSGHWRDRWTRGWTPPTSVFTPQQGESLGQGSFTHIYKGIKRDQEEDGCHQTEVVLKVMDGSHRNCTEVRQQQPLDQHRGVPRAPPEQCSPLPVLPGGRQHHEPAVPQAPGPAARRQPREGQ